MADPTPPTDRPADSVCPWCSAAVTPTTVTCPSCKAVLISDDEPNLPGVTAVDDKILRGEKPPPPRNRLLQWISGEYPDQAVTPVDSQAIAPPEPDVQREIRRLEQEAEIASLQAEADALLSEAIVEGRVVEAPDGIEPLQLEPVEPGEAAGDGPAAAEADATEPGDAAATADATEPGDAAATAEADATEPGDAAATADAAAAGDVPAPKGGPSA